MKETPIFSQITSDLELVDRPGVGRAQFNQHFIAAIGWIQRARQAAGDGGISKGFDLLRHRWAPSYPETTGYTIPTLLNAARVLESPELEAMAFSLAEYLLEKATLNGGMVHWQALTNSPSIVFDTGQVIFGWLAAYRARQDERFQKAAIRSGDWLTTIQDPNGSWKTNQHLGVVKVIDTRVAWVLLELHQITGNETYRQAAVHNLDWAVQQQDETGWFDKCSFWAGKAPYTHTLAYTAEGLLESGTLLSNGQYITSAMKMANALLARQSPDGSLAGAYHAGWQKPSHWSCLTGNCQIAILWLRLFETTQETKFYEAAHKAIRFVARTQDIRTQNPNVRGAIAGSHPIYGGYERLKYPNWAAKFFIDAVMKLGDIDRGERAISYVG